MRLRPLRGCTGLYERETEMMTEDVSIKRSARIRRNFFFLAVAEVRLVCRTHVASRRIWETSQMRPSSHISAGITAKGFLQCCIQIPADWRSHTPNARCKKKTRSGARVSMNPCSNEWVCESVGGWSGKKHTAGFCRRQVQDPRGYHPKEFLLLWRKLHRFKGDSGGDGLQPEFRRLLGRSYKDQVSVLL